MVESVAVSPGRWPFLFVVLTIWASVAPVAYVFHVGSFGIAPYEIFEACAVASCVFLWAKSPRSFVPPVGMWWLLAFMALTSASALMADNMRAVVTVLGRFWLGWLMVFLLPSVVTDRTRLGAFLDAMLIQAVVLIALTVGAALGSFDLPSLPPVLMIQFQKNEYATYLAFAVAVAFATVQSNWTAPWARRLAVAVAVSAVVSWSITYSRSGLVAMLGTLGLLTLLSRSRRVGFEAAALVLLGVVAWWIMPDTIQNTSARAVSSMSLHHLSTALGATGEVTTDDTFQQTIDERLVLDRAAVRTIGEHPLTGLGLTQWQVHSPVKTKVFDVKRWHPITVGATIHNRWLLIAAESGLPTLAAYLGFVGYALWRAWRLRPRVDAGTRFVLDAMIACTAALQVAMLAMPGTLWEYNQMALLVTAVVLAEREANARSQSLVAA